MLHARGADAPSRQRLDAVAADCALNGASCATVYGNLADDIAALVPFLLPDEARHITGQVIHVDGGLTLG